MLTSSRADEELEGCDNFALAGDHWASKYRALLEIKGYPGPAETLRLAAWLGERIDVVYRDVPCAFSFKREDGRYVIHLPSRRLSPADVNNALLQEIIRCDVPHQVLYADELGTDTDGVRVFDEQMQFRELLGLCQHPQGWLDEFTLAWRLPLELMFASKNDEELVRNSGCSFSEVEARWNMLRHTRNGLFALFPAIRVVPAEKRPKWLLDRYLRLEQWFCSTPAGKRFWVSTLGGVDRDKYECPSLSTKIDAILLAICIGSVPFGLFSTAVLCWRAFREPGWSSNLSHDLTSTISGCAVTGALWGFSGLLTLRQTCGRQLRAALLMAMYRHEGGVIGFTRPAFFLFSVLIQITAILAVIGTKGLSTAAPKGPPAPHRAASTSVRAVSPPR